MMPRIEAEERLNTITDGAIAMGNMEDADRRRIVGSLQRQANGDRRVRKADRGKLGLMGIGVRVVPKQGEDKA